MFCVPQEVRKPAPVNSSQAEPVSRWLRVRVYPLSD